FVEGRSLFEIRNLNGDMSELAHGALQWISAGVLFRLWRLIVNRSWLKRKCRSCIQVRCTGPLRPIIGVKRIDNGKILTPIETDC
ncbi:MAG TPA: hypothetical protein VGH13_02045, partial [Xanthobacteraceae bacterium]